MTERNPIFELHIRPMFRLLDRQHMLRVGQRDLWDYNYGKRESAQILIKLKGPGEGGSRMPTEKAGGAWPSEWISLFDRWIQGGFRRLSRGKAKNLTLREDSDLGIFLQCSTDVPATTDDSSKTWFQSEFVLGGRDDRLSPIRPCRRKFVHAPENSREILRGNHRWVD